MKAFRAIVLLGVGLIVLGGCNNENEVAADPLDDPWVDAIASEEPVVAAVPELSPVEPAQPLVAEVSPAAELAAGVVETTSEREVQPSNAGARDTARSDSAKPAVVEPEQAPEQPAAESPAEAPAPVVEPASTPSEAPAKPASKPPITSADFHGSYRYAGGQAQRDDVTAAIEATVQQLSRAIHGIARKRLTEANPVDSTLEISVSGDKVTTTFASGFDVTCVIDGPTVNTTGTGGEKLAVRVRSKDGKLVQVLQGKEGARTIVYVLSADRKQLTVHHKITADRLPAPLTYRLTYSRK